MWQMSGLCWVRMFGGMVPPLMLSPSMSAYTLVELFEVFLMCLSMMRSMLLWRQVYRSSILLQLLKK